MLSRGSYFRSVHKYLPRQLHLALSRGVYSALVCIISNLLNIFHIINFNYLCSLSLFFSLFELISIRKGKRVESRDKTRQLAGEGRFHGASLSLITIGRAFVLDFSMSPLPFATMTRVWQVTLRLRSRDMSRGDGKNQSSFKIQFDAQRA